MWSRTASKGRKRLLNVQLFNKYLKVLIIIQRMKTLVINGINEDSKLKKIYMILISDHTYTKSLPSRFRKLLYVL